MKDDLDEKKRWHHRYKIQMLYDGRMRIMFLVGCILLGGCTAPVTTEVTNDHASSSVESIAADDALWTAPLTRLTERTILKPFGIHITKAHSPVQPERFAGYHTGIDYEVLEGEQHADVPVSAICDGMIREKRHATGYGGVVVQECAFGDETVTVLYGHLRLTSIEPVIGDYLAPGAMIGVLGTGFTDETDGERKHLHFAVHRGRTVDYRGYVHSADELKAWIDPATLLTQEEHDR